MKNAGMLASCAMAACFVAQDARVAVPAASCSVAGRVVDDKGAPLAGWWVDAETDHISLSKRIKNGNVTQDTCTDREGRFWFDPGPGPRFALVVRSPEKPNEVALVCEDFELGEQDIVLRPEIRPSAFVEGVLSGPNDVELIGAGVCCWSPMESVRSELSGRNFRIGPLRSGEYELYASARNLADLHLPLRLDAGATLNLGALRLEPPGWIEVELERADAEALWNPSATAVLADCMRRRGGIGYTNGRGRSEALAPGHYLVRSRGFRSFAPDREVDVESGRTTEVKLVFQPATDRALTFRLPDRDPSTHVHVRVTDARGTIVADDEAEFSGHDRFWNGVFGLIPGIYQVEARAPTGRSVQGSFTLDRLVDSSEAIEFELH